ncbi:MAG: tryptophan synthase subunit alpha [Candidatus Peregrinibacteria bacterium]|nr:tryptophan synthase subunit alpha [Candidatus Peregrinibacteria bacterium]
MFFVTYKTMLSNPYAEALKKKGNALFIPFAVLGDPNKDESLQIIRTLIENGADALELGFPFSDPPADGPIIQAADVRALHSGIKIDDCFDILEEVRSDTDIPIGLLVYYNLVLQRGTEKFYEDCARVGVNSVLIADLPLEHAQEVVPLARKHGIAPVFLVSELTTKERLQQIGKLADGYLYVVSYLGVTGVTNAILGENIHTVIQRIRPHTSLPLFVGFGINTVEQVQAAVDAGADGVIVGSRIVQEFPSMQMIANVCRELQPGSKKNMESSSAPLLS